MDTNRLTATFTLKENAVSESHLTAEMLWSLPRVGSPVPDAEGERVIIPVTTHDVDENRAFTRLWLRSGESIRPLTAGDKVSSQPAWSPDGRSVVYIQKDPGAEGSRAQLMLLRLDGGEPEKLTDLPLGVSDPKWFPDGKRIAFLSPLYEGHWTPEETRKEHESRKESKVKAKVSELRFYRFWDRWVCEDPFHHIFALDVAAGELTDLTPDLERFFPLMDPVGSWDIAPFANEIAFTAVRSDPPYNELISGVYLMAVGGEPRLISGWTGSHASRPRYSPDGRYVVYGAQEEEGFYADKTRLVAHERERDSHVVLTEAWDRSCAAWEFADRDTLLIQAEDRGANAVYSLAFSRAVNAPGEVEPQQGARGGWFSGLKVGGDSVFCTRQGIKSPPEAVRIDKDGGEHRLSAFAEAALDGVGLGEPEEHYFEGADGDKVQVWLLYPPGVKERRNLPLVHLIHGGPHGVFGDQWHWRWCSQAFAAQGYLVAMVNFHGSTSWGNEFARCIMGEWGKKPFEDIEKATDYLIEQGLADPDRMACAGGSYGGYMVSWIAAHTDRYKCLVNHAGVSDLQAQYARDVTPGREKAMGGEPWGDIEGLDRYSPMRHSSGFKSPMLVIHGELDYRVPYTQGLQTYNAYRAQELEARLVVYPDENHWILKPQNSIHWYGEVLGWLKRWLG